MPITTNAIKKENDRFISPFRMILSGSSGAGKTHFAGDLIKSDLFEDKIGNLVLLMTDLEVGFFVMILHYTDECAVS